MSLIRGQRQESLQTGYDAPFRKSLIDPDLLLNCPRYAILGVTLVCGLLFLQFLPNVEWKVRLFICGGIWVVAFAGMLALTKRDPQWAKVAYDAASAPDSLEV
jgi:type IV secretory pathway TrbD component